VAPGHRGGAPWVFRTCGLGVGEGRVHEQQTQWGAGACPARGMGRPSAPGRRDGFRREKEGAWRRRTMTHRGGTGGIGRSATIPREHTRDPHTQGQGEHSKADRGFMTNRLWPFGCALPGGLRGTEETDRWREGEGKVEGREGCRCSAFAKDGGSTVISQGGDNGREGEGGEGNNGDSGRTHQRDQWGLSSDE